MNTFQFIFYETELGKAPVEEFIDKLKSKDLKRFEKVIQMIRAISDLKKNRQPVPSHYFKYLEDDIWEIRANNIRIFCFMDHRNKKLVLMAHAIVKKQNKIPSKDLTIVKKRRKDWERRINDENV